MWAPWCYSFPHGFFPHSPSQVAGCKMPSSEQSRITQLLRNTFSSMRQELEALAGPLLCSPGMSPGVGAEQTQALLEQYSELLLRAVERRMERKL